ncbi:hypothetical protein SESBI_45850 [Sesbania bispinosa]|nr:hypothetical protein SESBI_45850 [Sesbania bispinosa]
MLKGGNSVIDKREGSMKSSSSSLKSRWRNCWFGDRLLLLTSKSSKNPNRHFWRCPN